MFKYSKFYSGGDPEFIEGDIFRIIVPLNDGYLEDIAIQSATQTTQSTTQTTQSTIQSATRYVNEEPIQAIIKLIESDPSLSQKQMAEILCLNPNTLKYYLKRMREKGIVERTGTSRKGRWIVKSKTLL